jgi:apolipoprotein N-acyltransferase
MRDLLLLALSAGLYTVAAPPYTWSSAGWFALAPLFLALRGKTPRGALFLGFLYGLFFGLGITHWSYPSVAAYFPYSFPVNVLLTLAIYGIFVGPYTGSACMLMSRVLGNTRARVPWLTVPAIWAGSEFTRAALSGFAWELLSYTQYPQLTLIQIVDITGVHGLSFLMALNSYVIAEAVVAVQRRLRREESGIGFPWPALCALLGGMSVVWLYGVVRLQQYAPPAAAAPTDIVVAVVQGNVPHEQRWMREHYTGTLLKYVAVTTQGIQEQQPDLIVWPEFAVGFHLDREPLLYSQLQSFAQDMNAPLLLGAPRMEQRNGTLAIYNSAYLIPPRFPNDAVPHVYDKIRLIPFVEYRPLALPALMQPQTPEYPTEFTPGENFTVFATAKGTFGVMICYEATHLHLARRLVKDGAQFLINISNDTWMVTEGQEAAQQHFSMTVFRAVETRRYLVRAAAAGISGYVDPAGRPFSLSSTQEGVTFGRIAPRQELTVYTRYGDWFAFVCLGVTGLTLLGRRKNLVVSGKP